MRRRSERHADRPAYRFLPEGESEARRLTWSEVDREARAVAALLQESVAPGERALLLYPSGLEFVTAFLGCLYAGVVAVPASPPRPRRSQPRLAAIAHDAEPALVLTHRSLRQRIEGLGESISELQGLRILATDELDLGLAERWRDPGVKPSDLAFLQYTSGSTALPKGVVVTNGNLLHNEETIRRAFGQSEDSIIVSWLPLYHDMGLIGGVLQPLYVGAQCVLMPPLAFLQRPMRWLQAIDRYRATTSGGPNFAYELCVQRRTDPGCEALDLSSWDVAFNGAEPVRPGTLGRFARAFAEQGFRNEAFFPCYGLAEATLFVSGGTKEAPPIVEEIDSAALERDRVAAAMAGASARALVSCGGPWLDTQVVIADPESLERLPGDRVGEIWVSGPSVAQGYWRRPEATEREFCARLSGEPETGPFLRTGDLGFLLDGQLFVTGRLKDLIIIRGRNHYPQDIELTAESSHPGLRAGGGVAFTLEGDAESGERLVVVQELARGRRPEVGVAAEAIRRAIVEEHEVQVHEVVLVRDATVPRTSSGKVQRSACRALYLEGGLDVLGASVTERPAPIVDGVGAADRAIDPSIWALPPEERSAALVEAVRSEASRLLGVSRDLLASDRPLAAFGLDSLAALQLRHALERGLGISLPLSELAEDATPARLAEEILAGLEASPGERSAKAFGARGPRGEAGRGALSRGQEALWFLQRLAPESPAWNIVVAARAVGGLDVPTLVRAFDEVVDRHPSLASSFEAVAGRPVRGVGGFKRPVLQVVDVADLGEPAFKERLEVEAWRPFALEAEPLLRALLFRRAPEPNGAETSETPENDAVLLLVLHHLVADLWSLAVLARDLGAAYARLSGRAGATPGPVACEYDDFVEWQRESLDGPEGERLWQYWSRELAGSLPTLDLPTDRPYRPARSFRGRTRSARISAAPTTQGATRFSTLLAAYFSLLHRYTGQEDLLVGTPVAGRGAPELAEAVGYFVNLVVLRADLSGAPGFAEVARRARRTVASALAHQAYPFPLLAERLQPERNPGRPPIFQAAFVLQQTPRLAPAGLAGFAVGEEGARIDLGGLALEAVALADPTSQFDLSLVAAEVEGGLVLRLTGDAHLFDEATVARLLGHFEILLASVAATPELPAGELSLLAEAERHQLLHEWNGGGEAEVPRGCLHRRFAEQVERVPDAVAATLEEASLTYRELDRRAGRLARRLGQLGVAPGSRVALCVERSFGVLVGALGILKAGAAYVPLDPAQPGERLGFMLADSGAAVLVTEPALAAHLPAHDAAVVLLGEEGLGEPDGRLPAVAVPAEAPSYVIYTSGSTGRPKGVTVTHGNVLRLFDATDPWFGFGAADVWTLFHSYAFDFSVWEIWGALLYGGRVVVVPYWVSRSPEAFHALVLAEGVTVLNQTPSAFRHFMQTEVADRRTADLPLRWVVFGGEALDPRSLAPWWNRHGDRGPGLVNMYGITETTVHVTFRRLAPAETESAIGMPIPDLQVYVLDRGGEPVPVGVAGELCVGGAGVATGYLNRPDLSAERFVPDPYGARAGGRLYRSGDLARRRAGGDLEYLGRIDHQVKVRGFRIELGEIEAALAEHPRVGAAVVVARDDTGDGPRLVAYVTGREGAAPDVEELRRHLKARLPEYMVPAAFVLCASLQLTINGKVDRRALPAPAGERVAADGYVAPRGAVEQVLAGIWAEVLGTDRIGARDDFFALGGHSLLGTRITTRVREAFGVELPLRAVFEAPILADQAERVLECLAGAASRSGPALPLSPVGRTAPLPPSYAQQRLWALDAIDVGGAPYNLPATLALRGRLEVAALISALDGVRRRHEALRTSFPVVAGRPVQRIDSDSRTRLETIDLSGLSADLRPLAAARIGREDACRRFDLGRGPLLRTVLLRLDERRHDLLLTLHHAVCDGWALDILAGELSASYGAAAAGRAMRWPDLPIQVGDHAVWQRRWLEQGLLESQIAYWRRRLDGLPTLELPADRPRPAVPTLRGGRRRRTLAPPLAAAIEALARQSGATLFMMLAAASQAVFARHSGQDETVIGFPVAGRSRVELEGLIGCFVNTLVLRLAHPADGTFAALLGRVRDGVLDAEAHQEVPFEHLVQVLQPERDFSLNPLFQVMVLAEEAPRPPRLADLDVRIHERETGTAKVDLTLSLVGDDRGRSLRAEYGADLFDPPTIERLLDRIERLFAGVVAAPQGRTAELSLIGEGERHQLVLGWNDTSVDYPGGDRCLHELFAAQVAKTPDRTAVVFGAERLSYLELSRRAQLLARHLRGLGVGPEVRVGVAAERSVELMVGLLGVLEAGGAYVPLDPDYPHDRLSFMAADSDLGVVLSQRRLAGTLPPLGRRQVALDVDPRTWEPAGTADEAMVGPENLAYVIYTSGSTGRPKGAMNSHRGIVNRLLWMQEAYGLGADDVVLQKTPASFDVSVWELFWPLLVGARLVLARPGGHREGEHLAERIATEGVTTVHFVPSMLRAFLETPGVERCVSLRRVIASGEALGEDLETRFFERLDCELHNLYGPTEAAVDVTFWACAGQGRGLPIGRPIGNLRIHLLDRELEPVPIGTAGELLIGGVGLGRGYLSRPELTAERFVPDPLGQVAGGRLYRTGDLARHRRDGAIEYLGRLDHQVKVRGFRIELGEIEAALLGHPGVADAVAIVREDVPGDRRLVAYVRGAVGTAPGVDELREFLRTRLPDAMVPGWFVPLQSLPLTPSGKVDRKALSAPGGERPALAREYVAPRTPAESALCAIWSRVLGVDRVGVHDDFFALGGDSILGVQIVARAAESGLLLSARQLFQHPTVADLASVEGTAPRASVPEREPAAGGDVPLTPVQHWFFERETVDPDHFNQSVLLAVRRRLNRAALASALWVLIERHDALRLRFERSDGGWTQRSTPFDGDVPLSTLDLSAVPGELRSGAVETASAAAQASLDLAAGPLLRAVYFDLDAGTGAYPGRLLLAVHHLAVDGVSWRILLEELERGYLRSCRGAPPDLAPVATSYRRWAERLKDHAGSAGVRAEAELWRQMVRPRMAHLPVEGPAGPGREEQARTVAVELSAAETRALLLEVPRVFRARIQEVLLAAVARALAGWIGSGRLPIDLEGHGRAEEEVDADLDLSRTVGWFTAVFPVALDLVRTDDPAAVLRAVKERLRAIPRQGIGYGVLRYLSDAPEAAALREGPQAEVIFNYLGRLDRVLPGDSLFAPAPESAGRERSPARLRRHLLEIDARVGGDRLMLGLTHGPAHRRATVEALAAGCLAALRELVARSRVAERVAYAPSDFPLAGLDQPALDRLAEGYADLEDLYPLSPMQQALLLQTLRDETPGMYVVQVACRIGGDLDRPAFLAAWRAAVARHAVLRTAFVWEGLERPLQAVLSRAELPIAEIDWRGVAVGAQGERLDDFLRSERERGFDLSAAPLLRLALLRLADGAHGLAVTFHHLILDGWSVPLLLREVFARYEAARRGAPAAFDPPRPFRDYVTWLERQDPSAAETFWRRRLAGFDGPTPSPSAAVSSAGLPGERSVRLSRRLTERLYDLSRRRQVTLGTLVQGAWGVLLSRYADAYDVLFGSVVAGRTPALPGIEKMLGVFINTLPVRAEVVPEMPGIAWLRRFQEEQIEARQHDHSPLVQVQRWSGVGSEKPLFLTLLVFENYPLGEALARSQVDLAIDDLRAAERTSYPLTLTVVPGAEITLGLRWAAGRLDAVGATRLFGNLERLLDGFALEPERPVSGFSLLGAAERHQALIDWNDSEVAYPGGDRTVHELVSAQAALTPDAVAVDAAGGVLTYAELERSANRLANHLAAFGAGPETRVALAVERSPEMVVGMLGILKTGAAYVPLDPEYPRERLAFMLEDSRALMVVTRSESASALPASDARRILLDKAAAAIERRSASAPPSAAVAESPAYAIYTSGSTGRPKGVLVSHRGIVNRLLWQQHEFPLDPSDRVLQKTPLSFDASGWEVFLPLLAGARLELAEPGGHRDSAYLVRRVAEAQITVLQLVPSQLRLFLEEPLVGSCSSLRRVFSGGEALTESLRRRFYSALGADLANLYGPTESSIDASFTACRPNVSSPGAVVPLGRPLGNVRVVLLDGAGEPVPAGAPGELAIGGRGLARGYLGRPELTAERFLPDSISGAAGARLYRTGDRARHLPDGRLEYLGRIDHQVKVRGVRIELREIESLLRQLPGIREAVVLMREGGATEPRLVAYVVGETVDKALRAHLRKTLPEAMIPSYFAVLPELPLLPNGKLDPGALPAPDDLAGEAGSRAPRTPAEELVAAVWGEVLGRESIGPDDDFFGLGGHSLLATRVATRLGRAFGVEVPLRVLFDAPTAGGLAAAIEALRGRGAPPPPPITAVAHSGPPPLSFAQQRLWLIDQLGPGSPLYNLPAGFRLSGRLRPSALAGALAGVVARHGALRTTIGLYDGEPVQEVAAAVESTAPGGLPCVDLAALGRSGVEALRLSAAEAVRPFDLSRGPLLRSLLLRLEEGEHLYLINLHHLVSDGWSTEILVREIAELYRAAVGGEAPALPPLAVQYTDYAVWQRAWMMGEVERAEIEHWRRRLAGAPPLLDLPADRPRPAVQSHRGARCSARWSADLADGLRRFGRSEGATPFMLWLSAFHALLARVTGQRDPIVGTAVAGRGAIETEGLIGLFVNTLALRLGGADARSFRSLSARAREIVLEGHEHQFLPFERLVEEIEPQRSLAHSPLVQAVLILEREPTVGLDLPDLRLQPLDLTLDRAKFDLTLAVSEIDGALSAAFEYATDLFDGATARRLLSHLETLVTAAIDDPDALLAELPLLSTAERHQMVLASKGSDVAFPALGLDRLLAAQAERTPEAEALIFAGRALTYGDLHRRSGRLAHELRRRGVGPEVRVGVFMDRCPEMVVAILATLRAGGAYVPLDPSYPEGRLAFMLGNAGIAFLLTRRDLLAHLPKGSGASPLFLEDPLEGPDPAPGSGVDPDNLAYVIYTSGATGEPRGVMVPHRGVVNLSQELARAFGLAPGKRLLMVPSLSFDASVEDLFPALVCGATLVLPSEAEVLSGQELRRLCERERVAVLDIPGALWRQWLEELEPGSEQGGLFPDMELLVSGGESLPVEVVRRWEALTGGRVPVVGPYGPTEATVTATLFRAVAGELPATAILPIGRPLANVDALLLDANLEPVPILVPGELYLGGVGVSRGYLGRPDLTAERFLPDPFAATPGGRFYRTGDLARRLPAGDLEFLGRIDQQVKIRGFRVEPREVEAQLALHPTVRQAAVSAREVAPGDRRLLAWVVAADGSAPAGVELREFLGRRLPGYMVPSAFFPVAGLPLTPSGKVDLQALAVPEDGWQSAREFVAPRTPVEEALAGIWSELLGVDRVGIEDDFFDLGGHSLLAVRLMMKLRKIFKVDLPMRSSFEATTIGEMASLLLAHETKPGQTLRTARMLLAIQNLSPAELSGALDRRRGGEGTIS
jgi:amino acid adenylation domain-containing protein/non-ribosomal peptide synthase protein (TIGR01720 family)